jgi:hypothetical protein
MIEYWKKIACELLILYLFIHLVLGLYSWAIILKTILDKTMDDLDGIKIEKYYDNKSFL